MRRQPQGFSLVELIVVIIILGVLAISLVPRFFSLSGTSEYLVREQAIAVLRRAQQQAMHCTAANVSICPVNQLSIASNQLGITTACLNDGRHLCITDGSVSLSLLPAGLSSLNFDSWGRPVECSDPSGCLLQVQGQSSLRICIEQQGYIHAC